ncbi:hypothetical protein EJB05_03232, partial [Eragrostis curvula]
MEAGVSSSLGVETTVSSSLGAMGPLLRKLDLLLAPKYQLPKRVKEGIELLKEDLEEVSSALLELLTVATTSLRAKCWMEEARDLSYDVEDFVDGMIRTRTIADARMRSARGPRVRRVKIAGLPALPKRSTRISRIETFRTLLREARERYERYQLDYCCSSSSLVTTRYNQTPALYGDAANLVGIMDSKINLIEMLAIERDQQLKVVSIVGPAGLGKTTLAKQVYHELGKKFEFRAFVRASRKPDTRRLLGAILSQVQQHQQLPFNAVPVQHLIDILKEHFRDKRYFIVIDDLWDRTAWDILCAAFPHGDNSSRIIITTENVNVSFGCCGSRHCNILKMKPLDIHDSGKLFFSRVFISDQCPDKIKEISHALIRDCGGLPLAIINLAGLLAGQLDCSELWHHVQDNLCSIVNGICTVEDMQKEILNLCYNCLPRCLKTCLLYFTMYPEGYIIRKVDLVKQWIAEGFIIATERKQNVEIAEGYFDELVNRGMIEPAEIDYNYEVLSCTVHHIVLDFITEKSKEEKFIFAIDCSQTVTGLSTKFHRLSIYSSSARYGKQPAGITMSHFRSLAFFGPAKYMPSIVKLKLLRVLILEIWGNHDEHTSLNMSRVCRLLQLRYLKVSSDIVVELPFQMRDLLYLETLEIDARICAVPMDIVRLPRLMHLCLRGATKLPNGIGRIKSLCTLQYFDLSCNSESNIWSLGELTNLRHLHLTCSATLSDEHLKRKLIPLVSSLRKFSNLQSLTLTPVASGRAPSFDISSTISSPSVFLQRLELLRPICIFSRLPHWLGQLHGLRILNIVIRDLASDDINILRGLPALTVLLLYVRTALKRTIIFTDMAFSALRYLKLSCSVMFLSFEEGTMPDLRRLKLCFNAHIEKNCGFLVDGIENLLNLHEVAGRIGKPHGADKIDRKVAEALLEEAIRKHPRSPSFNIRWVDFIGEECPPLWKQHEGLQEDLSGENDILEGRYTEDMSIPSTSRNMSGAATDSWEYNLRKYLLLLATLVATVTYTAGLNPPGGVWQDATAGHLAGDPIMRDTSYRRYLLFYYTNATAFASSLVVIVLILIVAVLHEKKKARPVPLLILRSVMLLNLFSLMGAYAAGTCRDKLRTVYSIVLVLLVAVYVIVEMVWATATVTEAQIKEEELDKDLQMQRKMLMLHATFAASLTYLAGLSAPGGFWNNSDDGHRAGHVVLKGCQDTRLEAFFVFNTTTFVASLLITVLLLYNKLRFSNEVRFHKLCFSV